MTKQIKLKGLEIGSMHKTNNCGDIEILDIIDSRNVLVRFKRTAKGVDKLGEKYANENNIPSHDIGNWVIILRNTMEC